MSTPLKKSDVLAGERAMTSERSSRGVSGWIVVDKPAGVTSNVVVQRVKRFFGGCKTGHGGTLDPFATGVLPIALGEATKTSSFVMDGSKTYEFTLRWGIETDTLDLEGQVVRSSEKRPSLEEIALPLKNFIGGYHQIPPIFSALKVNGERSYKRARMGESFSLDPRFVRIDSLDLIEILDGDHARFRVSCGKGTYVRSLGRDIAALLGTCAHLVALRRTQVGKFSLENAVLFENISLDNPQNVGHSPDSGEFLISIPKALDDIPAVHLESWEAEAIRCGRFIRTSLEENPSKVILGLELGREVALLRCQEGMLRPVRVFDRKD